MAVWTNDAVYSNNQPPGTMKRGQTPDPVGGLIYERVDLPCVLLNARERAALDRSPELWRELKQHALRALTTRWAKRDDDWPVRVYAEDFAVIETWTRRGLREELGA